MLQVSLRYGIERNPPPNCHGVVTNNIVATLDKATANNNTALFAKDTTYSPYHQIP